MGWMERGVWHKDRWYDTQKSGGSFERPSPKFRGKVECGTPGRYHLYVSLACPWASRTVIVRALKGLEDAISMSIVHPHMREDGWTFDRFEGPYQTLAGDAVHGARFLRELYARADPNYTGAVTVPVLWDKVEDRLVNNESSEIIVMMNEAWNDAAAEPARDLYPEALRTRIDGINERIYHAINNGVYRAGFATTQLRYEEAVHTLFSALDELEAQLAAQRYLVGSDLTLADWRLFTTLVRFDAVYYTHFKCNLRRLIDYRHLWDYTRDLYSVPGVAETVALDHIKTHYYTSHPKINPNGIVPVGPVLDFTIPHGRSALS